MYRWHPTHKHRFSFDASFYDEICEQCHTTDRSPDASDPCPNPLKPEVLLHQEALRLAKHLEDD